jgi:glutamate synthase (NADPH/NADH) small chain
LAYRGRCGQSHYTSFIIFIDQMVSFLTYSYTDNSKTQVFGCFGGTFMAGETNSAVTTGRLDPQGYVDNFGDLHPPLSPNKAKTEADRCYFCHDAPCMQACPTSIDIALFIRQIAAGTPDGAAQTIFTKNIMGGMCARVCPTETLCQEVCVHVAQGNEPVKIGELQRYATDHAMTSGNVKFPRAASTGKKIAIVGAGPAGLSCAHKLAIAGHALEVFEARPKAGGLNEYGLAAYKATDNFAQREVDFVLSVGGIDVRCAKRLGRDISIARLSQEFDAVFLALGLGRTYSLGIDGEELEGVYDAVDYIADIRQSKDLSKLPVGERVIVIGGGMTAIDIAVQIKKLGARKVVLAYRRGPDQMGASGFERELALTNGVCIEYWAMPKAINGQGGKLTSVEFERAELESNGRLSGTGETFDLAADQLFKAIGQAFDKTGIADSGLEMRSGRIAVDENRKTSLGNVWAGGDCVAGGEDLTVASVEDGNIAANAINAFLAGK